MCYSSLKKPRAAPATHQERNTNSHTLYADSKIMDAFFERLNLNKHNFHQSTSVQGPHQVMTLGFHVLENLVKFIQNVNALFPKCLIVLLQAKTLSYQLFFKIKPSFSETSTFETTAQLDLTLVSCDVFLTKSYHSTVDPQQEIRKNSF